KSRRFPGSVSHVRSVGVASRITQPLASTPSSPASRTCETDPGNLRDFIDAYGGDGSQSVLDLIGDQIVEVTCN
ncbi:MAG: hypothetical protein ACKOQZ_07200, partial [Actinomycetota bacterium]